jgi:hypothetical protein
MLPAVAFSKKKRPNKQGLGKKAKPDPTRDHITGREIQ